MKTAAHGFVITSTEPEARDIGPGRTIAGVDFPPQVRWWLTSGGLLRSGSRRRTSPPGAPPPAPLAPHDKA